MADGRRLLQYAERPRLGGGQRVHDRVDQEHQRGVRERQQQVGAGAASEPHAQSEEVGRRRDTARQLWPTMANVRYVGVVAILSHALRGRGRVQAVLPRCTSCAGLIQWRLLSSSLWWRWRGNAEAAAPIEAISSKAHAHS